MAWEGHDYGRISLHAIAVQVILLNLLIAVMSDSYDKVREDRFPVAAE